MKSGLIVLGELLRYRDRDTLLSEVLVYKHCREFGFFGDNGDKLGAFSL